MTVSSSFLVALQDCDNYAPAHVQEVLERVLDCGGLLSHACFARGNRVLVKPNLLRAHALTCTHPEIVRALCACLLDRGVRVRVADSPGFGAAPAVARAIGLEEALRPLGLQVENLTEPVPVPLQKGSATAASWGIARMALESDAIISVPRIKAHSQMRLTLAVKNMFGCICGLRKALAHAIQGRSQDEFCRSILTMYAALPPTAALVDGVVAMHKTGPSAGEAFPLGCVGASTDAMALDTALYALLGVKPMDIPLWHTAQSMGENVLPQAFSVNIEYSLQKPEEFYAKGFILPAVLKDVSFQPHRLLQSLAKRVWTRIKYAK